MSFEHGPKLRRVAFQHPADRHAPARAREAHGVGVEGDHGAAVQHGRDRREHALDAVRAAVMHEARALHLDEGARVRQAGHELGDGGEPGQRGPGMRAAEARRLAGVDAVELARHHEPHVTRGARRALEGRVVDDEGHAVRGDLHVELDVRNAAPPGRLERRQRVLRKVFRIAPVCDDRWQHAPNYSRAVDSRRLHRGRLQRPGVRMGAGAARGLARRIRGLPRQLPRGSACRRGPCGARRTA